MAFTINNIWGAETDGAEELASSGSDVSESSANTTLLDASGGDFHYRALAGSDNEFAVNLFEAVTDAGDDYIFGFHWIANKAGPGASVDLCWVYESAGADRCFTLRWDISADLLVLDASGSTIRTITIPFNKDVSAFVEVHFQNTATGTIEVFIDLVSQGQDTNQDLLNGSGISSSAQLVFRGNPSGGALLDFNSIYFGSGAANAEDRLGGCEVIAYRSTLANATGDAGGALDIGTWDLVQAVPFAATVQAEYTDAGAGSVDTDDSPTDGPNGDSAIIGTIRAIKGIWTMERSGGGSAAHYGLLGNSVDGTTRSVDFDPPQSKATYFMVSELASIVPETGEYCRIGFETTGGQDFECYGMLAQILHVPVVPVTVIPSGVSSTGSVGSVTVEAKANTTINGLGATGPVGSVIASIPKIVFVATAEVANTYYFDASDEGPTDSQTVWTDDDRAFNGLTSNNPTGSTVGTDSNNALSGGGTTAPATGGPINLVRARIFGAAGTAAPKINAAIYTDGKTTLLGTPFVQSNFPEWGDYVVLSQPPGGWTWAKLQALEVYLFITEQAGVTSSPARIEIEVTSLVDVGLEATGEVDSVTIDVAGGDVTVPVTGVEATGQVGSVTVEAEANTSILGLAAAAAVGAVTTSISVLIAVAGLSAAGSVGSVNASGEADILVTGVEATGQVGSVITVGDAQINLVGIQVAGQVGSVVISIPKDISVTGVTAIGQVDSVSIIAEANVPVIGIQATGQVGSVVISIPETIVITGLAATGNVSSVQIDAEANVPVIGIQATGAVGSVTVDTASGDIDVPVIGVAASGQVGTVTVDAAANVPVSGLVATGAVGSVVVTGAANIAVNGIASTGSVGTVTVTGTANIAVTGIAATGQVGSVIASLPKDVPVTGIEATGSVGTVGIEGKAVVSVIGLGAAGNVGASTVDAQAVVQPSGLAATGQVGIVTIQTGIDVPVIGIAATGTVGSVSIVAEANVSVSGLEATGQVGSVVVSIPKTVVVTGIAATGQIGTVSVVGIANVSPLGLAATAGIGTVTVLAVGDRFVLSDSSNIAVSGENTTRQLEIPAIKVEGDFDGGRIQDDENPGDSVDVTDGGFREDEWCVQATSDVIVAEEYEFRVLIDGTAQDTYTVTPKWTIGSAGAVNVPVTGVGSLGQVDSVTVVGDAQVDPAGIQAVGQVGSVTVIAEAVVQPSGIAGAGQVGLVTVIGKATVPVTGLSSTGQVGSVAISLPRVAVVAGVVGTASPGSVSITGDANIAQDGVEAAGQVGTVTVLIGSDVTVLVSGVSSTGQVGSVVVIGDANIPVTGIAGTGGVGTVTVIADANIPVTGSEGTGQVGTVTITIDVVISVTGVGSVGSVGTVTVSGQANILLTGIQSSGQVGTVFIEQESATTTILKAMLTVLEAIVLSPPLPIAQPGIPEDPPETGMWLEARFFPNETLDLVWNNNAKVQVRGYLQVSVAWRPSEDSLMAASRVADTIVDVFKKGLEVGPARVKKTPWTTQAIDLDANSLLPIIIPYMGIVSVSGYDGVVISSGSTTTDIIGDLLARLDTISVSPTLPIAWPGVYMTPPDTGMWLETRFIPSESDDLVWDNDTQKNTTGSMLVRVYYRPGINAGQNSQVSASEIADSVARLFPKGLGVGAVRILKIPSQGPAVDLDDRSYVPIMIPYSGIIAV